MLENGAGMKSIIVTPTNHFTKQFEERWGKQPDLIAYLNASLKEGYFIKDIHTDCGVVFPSTGTYIPLAPITNKTETYKAITFLWNQKGLQNPHKNLKEVRVQWV